MIQTQCQNEEIRQIRDKVMISSRCKDEDKVGNEVGWQVRNNVWVNARDNVWVKVWEKVWRKLFE